MARRPPDRIPTDGDLDGPLSSNHTPSSHSNQAGSSSRHSTLSLTISAPPSTASPAPSGGFHEAMSPCSSTSKVQCSSQQPLRQLPFHQLPQQHLRRDEEARPILLDSLLLLSLSDFRARSEKASHNRKNEKGSPGIGPSKHSGGTRSFRSYEDKLALDKDEDDEVTPNDVFLHVHMKDHDGATPDQPIDEEQLNYDAAGVCPKRRVYRLEPLARKTRRYADLGVSRSLEPMVRRSEFDAVVQRLAQFEAFVQSQLGMRMDFGENTSQAPPPPPPQEHYQQVGMDPTCSLQ
ncbi:hypothetical protein Scep_010181 [Stephania cephalantha]|uniref:Uncharacterized protein n=1 Tax=Stephania cephalantha TaxID=152367 RepID=A0AAP0PGU1_9MAGN